VKGRVLILGGPGNGALVAHAIHDARARGAPEWEVAGYLNDRLPVGEDVEGFPVRGSLAEVGHFLAEGFHFINTIYRIDGQEERLALFERLGIPDHRLATFVHPLAYVASNVVVGPGTVLLPGVAVSPGVDFGRGCLVLAGATVAHNTVVGDYCHLAAQSAVGAHVALGRGVHVGLNASIREGVRVGDGGALGMGAVALEDVGPGEVWVGVPARFLRRVRPGTGPPPSGNP
jgi:acetyltransferase EpsM